MFSLPVAAITNWNQRKAWDARRKPVLSDRILAATCHWLKGNQQDAWMLEDLIVSDACIDGHELVITYTPTVPDQVPFQAVFTLGRLELQTSAIARQQSKLELPIEHKRNEHTTPVEGSPV